MQEAQISLKTVAQLRQESVHFTVDAYQRGFRWTQSEVWDLLNDVREFSLSCPDESGAFYCLQPVVVAPAGKRKDWNVIDGQQRLTTLFLFYCCYSWLATPEERYNLFPFFITYTGKPRLQACLNALQETEFVSMKKFATEMEAYEDDIDCHYLLQACRCVGEFLQGILQSAHTRDGLRKLKKTFDTRVKLIWQEVPDRDPEAEAARFIKLNTGKIALTNAELIKALLLERTANAAEAASDSAAKAAVRARIASQWSDMETEFADPQFWNFLTGGRTAASVAGRMILSSPTRLDLLFDVMAMYLNRSVLPDAEKHCPDMAPLSVQEAANRERFSFYVFANFLKVLRRIETVDMNRYGQDCIGHLWELIRAFYRMFRSWYQNPQRYHRIGFLLLMSRYPVQEQLLKLSGLCRGEQPEEADCLTPPAEKASGNTGSFASRQVTFDEQLLRMIKAEVFGTVQMSAEACREWITGLLYPKDAQKIRQVLLLYNLACLEAGDRTARFPFEQYRDTRLNWDLEHINAVSDAMPGDDRRDSETNARRQWLKKAAGLPELEFIVTEDGRQVQKLIPELLRKKTYLDSRQPGTPDFVQVYEAVLRFFDDAEGPDHSIGNLTLLDGGINRAYRNDVFPLKRKTVLDCSIRGTFIPLCTRRVFMKAFPDSSDLLRWREPDKRAYTEEIIRFLCSFLKLESAAQQTDENSVQVGEGPLTDGEGQKALRLAAAGNHQADTVGFPASEAPLPYVTVRRDNLLPGKHAVLRAEGGHFSRRPEFPSVPAAASHESLWSLLSKQSLTVCIPLLQREYVYGRRDAKTERIRTNLQDDLFRSLRAAALFKGEEQGLNLGFIYGNLEGERRFIPVDGQQRLTTLFLLHWLLALQAGRLTADSAVRDALLRFQYETGGTGSRFCRQLVLQPPAQSEILQSEIRMSEQIRNCSWFQEEDSCDPTAGGMMSVLDALQERASALAAEGISAEQLFLLLTAENPPIRFQFLNLDDVGLTDSIYIKMNARGRPLTLFESFKAGLPSFLRQAPAGDTAGETSAFSEAFLRNLNGPWTDFFWRPEYRPQGEQPAVDLPVLRVFRFIMLTEYIVNAPSAGQTDIRNALTTLMQEPDEDFFSRLFRDGFCEVSGLHSEVPPVTARSFRRLGKLLNLLVRRKGETGSVAFLGRNAARRQPVEETAFRRLIGVAGGPQLNDEELVLLYAEYAFLIRYSREDGSFHYSGALKRWMRVVSNLTRNIWNLQADRLFRTIRSIHHLIESGFALYCEKMLLKWPKLPEALSAFPVSQVQEECMKAALMQSSRRWKREVLDAERVFPGGRIGMLFDFAGVTTEKLLSSPAIPADDGPAYSEFRRYLHRYRLLFDRNGVRPELEKKAILRRALLCYGGGDSYLLPPGKPRQSFLDNADRDVGFRRLLRDENEGRRAVLKALLDDLNETKPAALQLQDIIRRKTFSGAERWKEYLVTMPEILTSVRTGGAGHADPMGEWVFRNEQRFIRRNHPDDILLLSRTQTSSVNREYYSYVLFLKARKQGLPVYYHADYTESAEKYAWFESRDDGPVQILYRNPDGAGWRFIARRAEDRSVIRDGDMESMMHYLAAAVNAAAEN